MFASTRPMYLSMSIRSSSTDSARESLSRRLSDRSDRGFTIVEMSIALAIFTLISTFFAAQLVGSYRVYSIAKDRTLAEEIGTEAIESARNLTYANLGTYPGNPPGLIPRDKVVTIDGLSFDVTTSIQYVDDPIPGGVITAANYKRMRVTVSRDGQDFADLTTVIAPPNRAAMTRGVIKVLTADFANNTAIPNATLVVSGGPSPTRTDYTDAAGKAFFADLLPTTSGSPYYSITASAPGYSVLPEDVAPATAARTSLIARQVFSTTLRLFKTVTITANLVNVNGTPFTQPATLSISSSRGTGSIPVTGGTVSFSAVGTTPVIPSVSYTLNATSSIVGIPIIGGAVTQSVPNNYPTDLTSTFTIIMPPPPPKPLTVTVNNNLGTPVTGIPVLVSGGDDNITDSGDTGSNGQLVLQLTPSVLPYTVELPTQMQSQQVYVTTGPVGVTFTLVVQTVNFAFRDGTGAPVPGVHFTVSGGDIGGTVAGISNASGELAMPMNTTTTPYTIIVTDSPTTTQDFIVSGPMTYVVMMTSNIHIKLRGRSWWTGGINDEDPREGIVIQITGGDLNININGATEALGNLIINVPPSVLPYTIYVAAQNGFQAQTKTIYVYNPGDYFSVRLVRI
jgi:prepilin-type N-terminal cleavage/methylation domain-containing protein